MTGNIQFFRITPKKRFPSSLVAHIRRAAPGCAPDTARMVETAFIVLADEGEAAEAFLKTIRVSQKGTRGGRRADEAQDCLFVAAPRFGPEQWSDEKTLAWAMACLACLRLIMGPKSIIATCVLHLDESAPHVHAVVIPRTTEGAHGWTKRQREFCKENGIRVPTSAKTAKLTYSPLQDFIYENVSKEYGVKRGKKGSKAKHEAVDRAKAAELTVLHAKEQLELTKEEKRRFNEEQQQMRELQERALAKIYANAEAQDRALEEKDHELVEKAAELETTTTTLTEKEQAVAEVKTRLGELTETEAQKAARVKQLEEDEARATGRVTLFGWEVTPLKKHKRGKKIRERDAAARKEIQDQLDVERKIREQAQKDLALVQAEKKAAEARAKRLAEERDAAKKEADAKGEEARTALLYLESKKEDARRKGRYEAIREFGQVLSRLLRRGLRERCEFLFEWSPFQRLLAGTRDETRPHIRDDFRDGSEYVLQRDRGPGAAVSERPPPR